LKISQLPQTAEKSAICEFDRQSSLRLREWPVLSLRSRTDFLAHVAFLSLRARAAQNTDSHLGL
jgi:hypothetical protein